MAQDIKEVFANKILSLLNLDSDGGSDTMGSIMKKHIIEDLDKIFKEDTHSHQKVYFKPNHWYWLMHSNKIVKCHVKGAQIETVIDEHNHTMKEIIRFTINIHDGSNPPYYSNSPKELIFETKEELLKSLGVEFTNDKTQFAYYQNIASSTKFYGKGDPIVYPALKLNGEAGEVAEKVGKILRDKDGKYSEEAKAEIIKELGDVLWYITATATDLGYNLSDVAKMNMEKILSRKQRNKISGSGDNR